MLEGPGTGLVEGRGLADLVEADTAGAPAAVADDVRVVCQNTIRAALADGKPVYQFRHTSNASAQLHEARRALTLTVDFGRQLKRLGDRLATERCTERELRRALEQLYPGGPTDRAARSAQKARDAVVGVFRDGPTVGNAPGTRWCALNAIVEFDQHLRGVRTTDPVVAVERRFVRAVAEAEDIGERALAALTG